MVSFRVSFSGCFKKGPFLSGYFEEGLSLSRNGHHDIHATVNVKKMENETVNQGFELRKRTGQLQTEMSGTRGTRGTLSPVYNEKLRDDVPSKITVNQSKYPNLSKK